jgi:lysophospholipase L1-like esterase
MSIVAVITPDELDGNGQITKPGVVLSWHDFERHYLAIGDSWFSISDFLTPAFLNTFGTEVPLKQDTLIVNCAYPGKSLARIVDWSTSKKFYELLYKKNFAWEWDAVLLSAGGNDIVAAAGGGMLQPCANPASFRDFIVPGSMARFENYFNDHFRYLVELRNTSELQANRTIPILYHTYAYVTVRNAPAHKIIGPWLYKSFTGNNIPTQYWKDLSDCLMDELATTLRKQKTIHPNLTVIDSLANVAFVRAAEGSTGDNGDWLNEIHLNNSGKIKMAKYWANWL